MRTLVESLRRLYLAGRTSLDKVDDMAERGIITAEEREYIVGGGDDEQL